MDDDQKFMFRLDVTYAAGNTQKFAPAGTALTAAGLYTAGGAFLRDLANLKGEGVSRLYCGLADAPSLDDGEDAVRMLAACYDEELLRSDHVIDDLIERDLLGVDVKRGPYLTAKGREFVCRILIANQTANDGEEPV